MGRQELHPGYIEISKFIGFPLPVNAGILTTSLRDSLTEAAKPTDAVINSILTMFGIQIGATDVFVSGSYCGGATLVQ